MQPSLLRSPVFQYLRCCLIAASLRSGFNEMDTTYCVIVDRTAGREQFVLVEHSSMVVMVVEWLARSFISQREFIWRLLLSITRCEGSDACGSTSPFAVVWAERALGNHGTATLR
ncbi:hypothetical protein RRG08_011249 [Elysia crispata]|uniref:Uncharacterized protein n=1 Tax=Elysia crispata TaxID=231223 RepID=A0AAE0YNP9_9GAST|nr:hypothetical protein RRG08_011249 [Elysia crispata]